MNRYSLITQKMPREFVLLQGTGCNWGQCTFCDYHKDISSIPYKINEEVLLKVTGEYGVLDIINSGSCLELDKDTVHLIYEVAKKKEIEVLWFEAHWMYRNQLREFADNFSGITVKFRTGVETFDADLRTALRKGIPEDVAVKEIAKYFQGLCLLVGLDGQTESSISNDIEMALDNFEYFSVNIFVENTTSVKRNEGIIKWFIDEWEDRLSGNNKVEILISNTDLGVG